MYSVMCGKDLSKDSLRIQIVGNLVLRSTSLSLLVKLTRDELQHKIGLVPNEPALLCWLVPIFTPRSKLHIKVPQKMAND